MPAPYSSPWGRGSSYRRASESYADMRVSNAERAEVADRLSKHYSDGRLDEEEFNERIDRAMKAKTQSDLNGLFTDLPDSYVPTIEKSRAMTPQRQRRPFPRILFLALIVLITIVVAHSVAHAFFPFVGIAFGGVFVPWLVIGLVVFLWLRRSHRRHDRP
jgi:Domain of unknown function (DUF1707)